MKRFKLLILIVVSFIFINVGNIESSAAVEDHIDNFNNTVYFGSTSFNFDERIINVKLNDNEYSSGKTIVPGLYEIIIYERGSEIELDRDVFFVTPPQWTSNIGYNFEMYDGLSSFNVEITDDNKTTQLSIGDKYDEIGNVLVSVQVGNLSLDIDFIIIPQTNILEGAVYHETFAPEINNSSKELIINGISRDLSFVEKYGDYEIQILGHGGFSETLNFSIEPDFSGYDQINPYFAPVEIELNSNRVLELKVNEIDYPLEPFTINKYGTYIIKFYGLSNQIYELSIEYLPNAENDIFEGVNIRDTITRIDFSGYTYVSINNVTIDVNNEYIFRNFGFYDIELRNENGETTFEQFELNPSFNNEEVYVNEDVVIDFRYAEGLTRNGEDILADVYTETQYGVYTYSITGPGDYTQSYTFTITEPTNFIEASYSQQMVTVDFSRATGLTINGSEITSGLSNYTFNHYGNYDIVMTKVNDEDYTHSFTIVPDFVKKTTYVNEDVTIDFSYAEGLTRNGEDILADVYTETQYGVYTYSITGPGDYTQSYTFTITEPTNFIEASYSQQMVTVDFSRATGLTINGSEITSGLSNYTFNHYGNYDIVMTKVNDEDYTHSFTIVPDFVNETTYVNEDVTIDFSYAEGLTRNGEDILADVYTETQYGVYTYSITGPGDYTQSYTFTITEPTNFIEASYSQQMVTVDFSRATGLTINGSEITSGLSNYTFNHYGNYDIVMTKVNDEDYTHSFTIVPDFVNETTYVNEDVTIDFSYAEGLTRNGEDILADVYTETQYGVYTYSITGPGDYTQSYTFTIDVDSNFVSNNQETLYDEDYKLNDARIQRYQVNDRSIVNYSAPIVETKYGNYTVRILGEGDYEITFTFTIDVDSNFVSNNQETLYDEDYKLNDARIQQYQVNDRSIVNYSAPIVETKYGNHTVRILGEGDYEITFTFTITEPTNFIEASYSQQMVTVDFSRATGLTINGSEITSGLSNYTFNHYGNYDIVMTKVNDEDYTHSFTIVPDFVNETTYVNEDVTIDFSYAEGLTRNGEDILADVYTETQYGVYTYSITGPGDYTQSYTFTITEPTNFIEASYSQQMVTVDFSRATGLTINGSEITSGLSNYTFNHYGNYDIVMTKVNDEDYTHSFTIVPDFVNETTYVNEDVTIDFSYAEGLTRNGEDILADVYTETQYGVYTYSITGPGDYTQSYTFTITEPTNFIEASYSQQMVTVDFSRATGLTINGSEITSGLSNYTFNHYGNYDIVMTKVNDEDYTHSFTIVPDFVNETTYVNEDVTIDFSYAEGLTRNGEDILADVYTETQYGVYTYSITGPGDYTQSYTFTIDVDSNFVSNNQETLYDEDYKLNDARIQRYQVNDRSIVNYSAPIVETKYGNYTVRILGEGDYEITFTFTIDVDSNFVSNNQETLYDEDYKLNDARIQRYQVNDRSIVNYSAPIVETKYGNYTVRILGEGDYEITFTFTIDVDSNFVSNNQETLYDEDYKLNDARIQQYQVNDRSIVNYSAPIVETKYGNHTVRILGEGDYEITFTFTIDVDSNFVSNNQETLYDEDYILNDARIQQYQVNDRSIVNYSAPIVETKYGNHTVRILGEGDYEKLYTFTITEPTNFIEASYSQQMVTVDFSRATGLTINGSEITSGLSNYTFNHYGNYDIVMTKVNDEDYTHSFTIVPDFVNETTYVNEDVTIDFSYAEGLTRNGEDILADVYTETQYGVYTYSITGPGDYTQSYTFTITEPTNFIEASYSQQMVTVDFSRATGLTINGSEITSGLSNYTFNHYGNYDIVMTKVNDEDYTHSFTIVPDFVNETTYVNEDVTIDFSYAEGLTRNGEEIKSMIYTMYKYGNYVYAITGPGGYQKEFNFSILPTDSTEITKTFTNKVIEIYFNNTSSEDFNFVIDSKRTNSIKINDEEIASSQITLDEIGNYNLLIEGFDGYYYMYEITNHFDFYYMYGDSQFSYNEKTEFDLFNDSLKTENTTVNTKVDISRDGKLIKEDYNLKELNYEFKISGEYTFIFKGQGDYEERVVITVNNTNDQIGFIGALIVIVIFSVPSIIYYMKKKGLK